METTPTNKRYSGRVFDAAALEQVRGILRAHAGASRQQLSYRVCEALDWRKADGSLKDMSCRVALLRLHREGLIELPAPRQRFEPLRSYARRTPQSEPGAWLEAPLGALGTARLEPVERRCSGLWNELIDRYHYLGYKPLPGAQLRYFAYAGEQLLALLGFGAAAWQTAPRDGWIGWNSEQRQRNLGAVVNNARFLSPVTAMNTQKERMLCGQMYNASEPILQNERVAAHLACREFNSHTYLSDSIIKAFTSIFKYTGINPYIESPFLCDYGYNITLGDNVYFDFNVTILDCAPVTIGNNVKLGPGVQLYTAGHSLNIDKRRKGDEFALPITIKDDVWIGGSAIILPNVTIGRGSVVGAGSVVTKNIPPNSKYAGNPAKEIVG